MSVSATSPLSGMNAATISQNVTAHNIANINTQPYNSKEVIQTDVFPVGTRVSSVREDSSQNNDIAKQMTDLENNKNSYTANAKAFKVQNQMYGTLMDLVG
jgi:flagellar hook protein FlgE